MKTWRLTVGRAQIEQIEADRGEQKIRRPSRHPWRNAVTFAKREKQVHQEVHRKDEKNRGGDTRQNAAARIADSERFCDAHNNQAGPRQSKPVLQMGAKRCEQRSGEIWIETQILP